MRVGDSKDVFYAVLVGVAFGEVRDGVEEVACAFEREVQVVEVVSGAVLLGVVDVVVAGVHNEVVAVLVFDSGVADASHTCAEGGVDVEEAYKGEFDGQQLVAMLSSAPAVTEAAVEEESFEIAVQLVVTAEGDECMWSHPLPENVLGEGEEECGQVER